MKIIGSALRAHAFLVSALLLAMTSASATAAIQVSVTASPDPPRPGEILDVEITVTNDGLADLTDVSVVLDYPTGLTALFEVWFDGDCPSSACESGEQATFTIATLAAGQGRTFLLLPMVVNSATDGTIIPFDVEVFDDAILAASATTSITVETGRGLELALEEDRDPASAGDLLTYTLTYGLLDTSAGAAGSILSFPIPSGTTFVSASEGGVEAGGEVQWSLGGLGPGTTGERQVTVALDGGLTPGTILAAEAVLEDMAANAVRYQAATRVQTPIDLDLAISASPDPARSGETIDVEITVTNTGGFDRTGVLLTFDFPDHIEQLFEVWFDGDCPSSACETQERAVFDIGTLAAGTGVTFSLPLQILPVADGTVIALEAQVSDNTGASADSGTSLAVADDRGFDLALEEDRDPVVPGDQLTYVLTYGLLDTAAGAAGTTLSLPVPAGTTFVSASDGGAESGGVVEWSLGALNPGTTGERLVTVAVDGGLAPGAILTAEATLQDMAGNTLRYQAFTRVQTPTGLELTVSASPDPARSGETIDVELTVTNTDIFDRTGVLLTFDFPDHIEQLFETWFDGDCPSSACELQERALFDIGTLAAGTGVTFSLPLQILPTADGTVIALEAEVTDNTGAFVDGGTSLVVADDRGLDLALEENRDPVAPGGLLTYAITYGLLETGPGAADATLRLPLPVGTTFVSASDGGAVVGGDVQWPLGPLDPGATGQRRVTVEVDGGLTPGTILAAEAIFQESEDNTVRYQAYTRVQAPNGLELVVTASPDPARVGETLDVVLTVTNTDVLDRTGVVLSLPWPELIEQLFEIFGGDCPSSACETQERALFDIGTLAAGSGVTLSVPMQILPTADGTVVALEAEVTDNTGAFTDGGAAVAVGDARVLDLAVTASEPALPGCVLAYSLTFGTFDTGPGAPAATLEFTLPPQVIFESATNGGVLNGDTVQWDLGSLDPGAGGERRVSALVPGELAPGTVLSGQARFADRTLVPSEVRGAASTRVAADSPLLVRVAVSPDPAPAGTTLALELSATNTSGVTRSGVELLLEFPDHIAQLFDSVFDGDCPSTACETQERAIFLVPELAAGETISFPVPPVILGATADGTVIRFDAFASDSTGFQSADSEALMVGTDFDGPDSGDVNGDGVVNVEDLIQVIVNWGSCGGCPGCSADLNLDGTVNVTDLIEVIINWTGGG